MRWAAAIIAGLLSSAAAAEETASRQTVVFYNARLALRDGRPEDVLKLWLLRNSLLQRGERPREDPEFRSVVWAALGSLGLCQDGFEDDERAGAGLWPLGLHNTIVHGLSKGPPPSMPAPWDVFQVGRQQRFISLQDVLSAEELRSVTFFRTDCLQPTVTALRFGWTPFIELEDRQDAGWLLRNLLARSRATLVREKVRNLSVVEARIFDLDLMLAGEEARKARQNARSLAQQARVAGVSAAGAAELRSRLETFPEDSPQAAFLRRSLTWTPQEWLALNRERRLFLFARAQPLSKDPAALQKLMLEIIDELIRRKDGKELEAWIGFVGASDSAELRGALTSGERGKSLLELDENTGFRERAVIALHRGVGFLEAGELQESLRAFAYALQQAEASREAAVTQGLARRWLSYVLSRYETNDEVVATLKALVPRQEYNQVIEDLVWRAALRADDRSFERITQTARRGGSFDASIERLRPLSQGKPGEMATRLRDALREEPSSVLRFVRRLLENIEAEDADVRRANVPTLKHLLEVLRPLSAESKTAKSQSRTAGELMDQTQSILDGLSHLDDSVSGNARALSPTRSTFAGSIRLAPADPLPWPFRPPEPEAPSVFTPIVLEPVEWRDAKGALVFGWRLSE
ncbi:hypothetical protein [Archangium violaceum]|uniref:Uncharacterized protein n=1 Tax=Archangium violaceum Cb vi76 TaxID=1406225 RepID=A0A084T1C3_9BACT|nr:hypothetical protein [Archangium violaceum]KFA94508.1 hypothetical protein Q664_02445 [Archangium violaceum Cb vi76]